jgi:hypothetical protein
MVVVLTPQQLLVLPLSNVPLVKDAKMVVAEPLVSLIKAATPHSHTCASIRSIDVSKIRPNVRSLYQLYAR